MKVAVVSIDLSKLAIAQENDIPSPRVFYDMESASTFDCVLPGANIDRPDIEGDTPLRYFRHSAFDAFSGRLDGKHETLMETVRAVVGGPHTPARAPRCPVEDCSHDLAPGIGAYTCCCERNETLSRPTRSASPSGSASVIGNGEIARRGSACSRNRFAHQYAAFFCGRVSRLSYLREQCVHRRWTASLFGHPAWLAPYLRRELRRINDLCLAQGFELAVFGYEKSGAFVEHFDRLDASPERGPRSRHPAGTAFGLDAAYINRNITLRPAKREAHGQT